MNKKRVNIVLILLVIFISICILISTKETLMIDNYMYRLIAETITPQKTKVLKIITTMVSPFVILPLVGLMFVFIKNKFVGLCMALNTVSIYVINNLAKLIFLRPRPTNLQLIKENGYSYPSGHAMIAAAFYGFIIYLVCSRINNKYFKLFITIILIILILSIGFSRIYLGVHYFSDIIGGYLLSTIYLIIYISTINKYKLMEAKNEK